ncbi:metal dependent phosphohydrolase [Tolumonas auensis DSM 9187]|uniref:Metal dependent phosphohydrolase n=1 Tax=Tolumonas auensis (strain DSM 9187 / NBRC 110442 / TA 4) TaxID=595494 RepID=C4LFZ7_TOLAT|nr:HDOD domain-containing protein [Tolumonas auensis]ACQ93514.1 metal dependent phosphohydrolase [Tolumonas auensis DSM 9187]
MNFVTNHPECAELIWASRIEGTQWLFHSLNRKLQLSMQQDDIKSINPDGQWVICFFNDAGVLPKIDKITVLKGLFSEEHHQLINFHFKQALPQHKEIVRDLWYFYSILPEGVIREFLYQILSDRIFITAFFSARGSHRHHHEYIGGLLEHSYEVAFNSALLAKQFRLGPMTTSIAFIAGLLHDAGKIELYYNHPCEDGICAQHEMLTFMLLKSQLQYLRNNSPRYFEAISGCLKTKVPSVPASYIVETLVRMADKVSTDVYLAKAAFRNVPDFYWYTKSKMDNQVYKRLDAYSVIQTE